MNAGCWSETDICPLLRPYSFMNRRYRVIFQRAPLPVLQQNICCLKLKRLELHCLPNPISVQDCVIKSSVMLLRSVVLRISVLPCQIPISYEL